MGYAFEYVWDIDNTDTLSIDFEPFLEGSSFAFSATASIEAPSGDGDPVRIISTAISDQRYVNVRIDGGTYGNSYVLRVNMVTSTGRIVDKSIYIRTDKA